MSEQKEGHNVLFSGLGFWESDRLLLQRSMLYTFLLGFAAHGFMLVNLSVSHDAVFDFYDGLSAHQHQIGLGRILEPLYREITASGLLMPWTTGLVAFLWLGFAVFLVCRLLHLCGKMEVFLTAGIMTVNISVTAVGAAYTPWLAADMFALLAAVSAVFFWQLYGSRRQKKWLFFGVLSVCCSLSIYQCYLAVTVVLMIFVSMQCLLENKRAVDVFWNGIRGIGVIGVGGLLYYVLMKVVCGLVKTPLAEGYYDSVTNLWDNREPVFHRVAACLKEAATHFFARDESIYPYPVVWAVNAVLMILCAFFLIRLARQKNLRRGKMGKWEWLLFLALLAALPFAAYMMRLLNTDVHDLMVYAVWLLYFVPLLLCRRTAHKTAGDKKIYCLVAALLCFVIFEDIQTDNAVYVKKKVEAGATLSLMTQIISQVEQTEGYVPGETPVFFVGQVSEILEELPGTQRVKGISGCNKTSAITYEGTYQAYFENVMLRDVEVVLEKDAGNLLKGPEVARMPAYPQAGYVELVDGTVVVKLQ